MSFQEKIKALREQLIDRSLMAVSLFACLVLIPSLLRYIDLGWQPTMYAHIIAAVILVALYFFRKKVSINIKAHLFFIAFLSLPIVGLINFRIVGAGYGFVVVLILSLLIYGLRTALVYTISFVILFLVIGYLHIKGILVSNIDFNSYTNSVTSWFAILFGYVFIFIVLLYVVYLYSKLFMDHLKESWKKTEELNEINSQLKKTEKRYRALFEGSIDGILLIDKDYKISDCNKSFLNIIGYELHELIGKRFDFRLPDQNFDWTTYFLNLIKESGSQKNIELKAQHKNGQWIPIEVVPYMIESDNDVYLWAVIKDISEKKKVETQIYNAMVIAEEKERERYAKELHDGLGPLLSTALIYVNAISEEDVDPTVKEYSQRTYDIIKDSTNLVKEISNNLSPIILAEYGIAHAIRAFIEKAYFATTIKFTIIDNAAHRFSNVAELTIYRTLVELIHNTIKHSNASHVKISFHFENDLLTLTYEDDGIGFDYEKALQTNKGFGLLNLKNRILKIGGKYQYVTEPGKGIKIFIEFKE